MLLNPTRHVDLTRALIQPQSTPLKRSHLDLTRDGLGPQYRQRLAAFEQRLDATLREQPVYVNWALYQTGKLRTRANLDHWSDHPAYFEGNGVRYFTCQPYGNHTSGRPYNFADCERFAETVGFDGVFWMPGHLGFWNPPTCDVIVFFKQAPAR